MTTPKLKKELQLRRSKTLNFARKRLQSRPSSLKVVSTSQTSDLILISISPALFGNSRPVIRLPAASNGTPVGQSNTARSQPDAPLRPRVNNHRVIESPPPMSDDELVSSSYIYFLSFDNKLFSCSLLPRRFQLGGLINALGTSLHRPYLTRLKARSQWEWRVALFWYVTLLSITMFLTISMFSQSATTPASAGSQLRRRDTPHPNFEEEEELERMQDPNANGSEDEYDHEALEGDRGELLTIGELESLEGASFQLTGTMEAQCKRT
jgi:hypothetical protein